MPLEYNSFTQGPNETGWVNVSVSPSGNSTKTGSAIPLPTRHLQLEVKTRTSQTPSFKCKVEPIHRHQSPPTAARAHPQSSPDHLQPAQAQCCGVTSNLSFCHSPNPIPSQVLSSDSKCFCSHPGLSSVPLANLLVLLLSPPSLLSPCPQSPLLSDDAVKALQWFLTLQISSAPPLLQPRPYTCSTKHLLLPP